MGAALAYSDQRDAPRDEVHYRARAFGGDARPVSVLVVNMSAQGLMARVDTDRPIGERLQTWTKAQHHGSRRRLLGVLDSARYLALLDALDVFVAEPPLRTAAEGKPAKVLAKAVRRDFGKVSDLVEQALQAPPGHDRDEGLHEARKKAKRTRYAAETATPAIGGPAKALAKSMKSLQSLLGEHQDSVMARQTLRELSAVAHAAGESAFTYGLLYGREERRAEVVEQEVPAAWERIRGATEV
jgi:CHAD domain-containing protein